jgi:hypothetical protein
MNGSYEEQQSQGRDYYGRPLTRTFSPKERNRIYEFGNGIGFTFALCGFFFIQWAGAVKDVSIANAIKIVVGLFLVAVAAVFFQSALDILDLGRVYL